METTRKYARTPALDLDRFVSEQNIARYRELLDASTDEKQRLTIIQQLADQVAKLRKISTRSN
jgi:hypothetical protein